MAYENIPGETSQSLENLSSYPLGSKIRCVVTASGVNADGDPDTKERTTQEVEIIDAITEPGVPIISNLSLSTPVAGQPVTGTATIEYTDTDGNGAVNIDDLINDGWSVEWNWNFTESQAGDVILTYEVTYINEGINEFGGSVGSNYPPADAPDILELFPNQTMDGTPDANNNYDPETKRTDRYEWTIRSSSGTPIEHGTFIDGTPWVIDTGDLELIDVFPREQERTLSQPTTTNGVYLTQTGMIGRTVINPDIGKRRKAQNYNPEIDPTPFEYPNEVIWCRGGERIFIDTTDPDLPHSQFEVETNPCGTGWEVPVGGPESTTLIGDDGEEYHYFFGRRGETNPLFKNAYYAWSEDVSETYERGLDKNPGAAESWTRQLWAGSNIKKNYPWDFRAGSTRGSGYKTSSWGAYYDPNQAIDVNLLDDGTGIPIEAGDQVITQTPNLHFMEGNPFTSSYGCFTVMSPEWVGRGGGEYYRPPVNWDAYNPQLKQERSVMAMTRVNDVSANPFEKPTSDQDGTTPATFEEPHSGSIYKWQTGEYYLGDSSDENPEEETGMAIRRPGTIMPWTALGAVGNREAWGAFSSALGDKTYPNSNSTIDQRTGLLSMDPNIAPSKRKLRMDVLVQRGIDWFGKYYAQGYEMSSDAGHHMPYGPVFYYAWVVTQDDRMFDMLDFKTGNVHNGTRGYIPVQSELLRYPQNDGMYHEYANDGAWINSNFGAKHKNLNVEAVNVDEGWVQVSRPDNDPINATRSVTNKLEEYMDDLVAADARGDLDGIGPENMEWSKSSTDYAKIGGGITPWGNRSNTDTNSWTKTWIGSLVRINDRVSRVFKVVGSGDSLQYGEIRNGECQSSPHNHNWMRIYPEEAFIEGEDTPITDGSSILEGVAVGDTIDFSVRSQEENDDDPRLRFVVPARSSAWHGTGYTYTRIGHEYTAIATNKAGLTREDLPKFGQLFYDRSKYLASVRGMHTLSSFANTSGYVPINNYTRALIAQELNDGQPIELAPNQVQSGSIPWGNPYSMAGRDYYKTYDRRAGIVANDGAGTFPEKDGWPFDVSKIKYYTWMTSDNRGLQLSNSPAKSGRWPYTGPFADEDDQRMIDDSFPPEGVSRRPYVTMLKRDNTNNRFRQIKIIMHRADPNWSAFNSQISQLGRSNLREIKFNLADENGNLIFRENHISAIEKVESSTPTKVPNTSPPEDIPLEEQITTWTITLWYAIPADIELNAGVVADLSSDYEVGTLRLYGSGEIGDGQTIVWNPFYQQGHDMVMFDDKSIPRIGCEVVGTVRWRKSLADWTNANGSNSRVDGPYDDRAKSLEKDKERRIRISRTSGTRRDNLPDELRIDPHYAWWSLYDVYFLVNGQDTAIKLEIDQIINQFRGSNAGNVIFDASPDYPTDTPANPNGWDPPPADGSPMNDYLNNENGYDVYYKFPDNYRWLTPNKNIGIIVLVEKD